MTTEEKAAAGCYYIREPWEKRENLRAFAMAAVTLGALLRKKESYLDRSYIEGGRPIREVFWFFESRMRGDHDYKLHKLWEWWNDDEWIAANPDHPLTLLWTYADNLSRAAKHVAECPEKVMFIRGKHHLLLSKASSDATKMKALEALASAHEKTP